MEELRSEIRAAFQKEQAAHPPAQDLRRNLVAAVAAQPRRERNLKWVAVAAALILGILVVAGLMSTRFAHRAGVPVPAATPKATPVADYGPPPAGVQLLYVHDPNNPSWLIGDDWSGQPRGTVKLGPEAAQSGVQMAPDGSAFQVGSTIKGGSAIFLDRLGNPIPANGVSPNVVGEMWADDNKHHCLITLNQQTYAWGLSTQLPGQPLRPVTVIARDPGIGQSGISLAACSFQNNLAIAVRTTIAWPAEVWVIRLTDGKVLSHRTYPANDRLSSLVASRDGVYVAESSNKGSSLDPSQGAASTIIRRVSDGKQVAALDPSMQVLTFSGDDSMLLVSIGFDTGTSSSQLAVIQWNAGLSIWTYRGLEALGSFTAQPDGSGFAIALNALTQIEPSPCGNPPQTPCQTVEDPLRDIVIVHGDGTETKIPGRYLPTW
jgi:hypothetical protein